ncbi:S41 family peptidase [Pseudoalteromonas sp. PA2MD11]|uniref:S41 family peptidase n=1 Tax=Pseudoalteromonas sp. PA2MD11 TaxID=2785057 RepID=UPI001ADECC94|nr:S41 family peptidase [Pseudoalteromonas sp. PA2MD11]
MITKNKLAFAIFLAVSSVSLSGCGGGSGSSSTNNNNTTTPPPTSSDPTWTAGVFEPSSEFKDQCAVPRTGNDPYNDNQPYPDTAGSEFTEKMWLRSWSDETYLWYNEIEDNDPDNFSSVAAYFEQLKTFETTDSGAFKDNFHFSEPTEDFFQESQSGVVSGYGINWALINNTPPRDLRVAYLEDNSPAANAGLQRGDRVILVNGVSIDTNTESGIDTLNEALFGPTAGDTHTFKVKSNDGTEKTFSLVAGNITQTPVQNVDTIITNSGTKVGYMQFNSHISIAQPELISAMNKFQEDNINELVIDFRYNSGGLLALSSQLAYMVAGPANTEDFYYYQVIENDKQPLNDPFPFINVEVDYSTFELTNDLLPDLNLSKVYVLSTASTCSASEAFINGLNGINAEVILIGGKTCGKPYGFTPTHNCATTYYTIQFTGTNYKGFGEYADGLMPTPSPQFAADVKGCELDDDFSHQLGDSDEALLSAALYHIENDSCPVVTQSVTAKQATTSSYAADEAGISLKANTSLFKNNMDLTRPLPAKEDDNE